MGAKLSNCSWNFKQFPTNNPNPTHLDCQTNISVDIPSIVIEEIPTSAMKTPDKTPEILLEFEPDTFPKITPETKSVPLNSNNWFRILPIMQKGEKLSDTHYWLINEPKHRRSYSARVKRNPPEMYVNASTLPSEGYDEPDLPYDLNEQISEEYMKVRQIKRGNSETNKSHMLNVHRGLVVRLMLSIPSATEMECNSVLIGANWDFETAERRLKVDLLHRKGYVNQQRCNHLLAKHSWSIEKAEIEAEKEFKQMLLERQQSSNSTKSHISSNSVKSHVSDDIG